MGMSDAQFKDFLRRDLQTFEDINEILNSGEIDAKKIEELQKKVNKEIKTYQYKLARLTRSPRANQNRIF